MKHWIEKNYKTLIIAAFLVPIITVAIVSISHVTKWYGISNPVSWSIYLSIGIEIAALSALAAISADMGKKVYFPFAVVTLVQFIGNIYFAYSFIDIASQSFKDWVDLVSPLVSFMGVEATDFVGHKRFLAFFAGGMLPIISLSFLHMLVKFTEEDRLKEIENNIDKKIQDNVPTADIADEINRLKLSQKDLEILENHLLNPNPPNEALKKAAEKYAEEVNKPTKEKQAELLAEIVKNDQELGLYDEDGWGGLSNQELIGDDELPFNSEPITPALSDEEVREMFMDEWERKFDYVEDEEGKFSTIEPTEEEERRNFSTITPNSENFFQDNLDKMLDDVNTEISNQEDYQKQLAREDGWSENLEQQFWSEQPIEPFATPEEVEKYGLDGFQPEKVLPEIIEEPSEEIIMNEEEGEYWKDHLESESSDEDLKKK